MSARDRSRDMHSVFEPTLVPPGVCCRGTGYYSGRSAEASRIVSIAHPCAMTDRILPVCLRRMVEVFTSRDLYHDGGPPVELPLRVKEKRTTYTLARTVGIGICAHGR